MFSNQNTKEEQERVWTTSPHKATNVFDTWASTETCTQQLVIVRSSQKCMEYFTKIEHVTVHKASLIKNQGIHLTQTKYSSHYAIKLEITNKKVILKNLILLEILKHFYYNWVIDKKSQLRKTYLELNDNENT